MINIFTPAVGDKSMEYLFMIFGSMNGLFSPVDEFTKKETLGAMFTTFNSVVLAIGALVVVYITVMGVVSSAHEGQFMGKKFHGLWTPIRVVIGIASMIPTSSGFSGLQIVMMWVIIQGIGAADTLWEATLTHIAKTGSPYPSSPSAQAAFTLQSLYKGLVCDASAHRTEEDPADLGNGGDYFCYDGGLGFNCSIPGYTPFTLLQQVTGEYDLGPSKSCGTLKFCKLAEGCQDPESVQCKACQGQHEALKKIIPLLGDVATRFVVADYQYQDFFSNSRKLKGEASNKWPIVKGYCRELGIDSEHCYSTLDIDDTENDISEQTNNFPRPSNATIDPEDSDDYLIDSQGAGSDAIALIIYPYRMKEVMWVAGDDGKPITFLQSATNEYVKTALAEVKKVVDMQNSQANPLNQNGKVSAFVRETANLGWILAGSFYYRLASLGKQNEAYATPPLSFTFVSNHSPTSAESVVSGYRNNYAAATALLGVMNGSSGGVIASNAQASQLTGPIYNAIADINGSFSELAYFGVDGPLDTDPVTALATFGMSLISICEITYLVLVSVLLLVGLFGFFSVYVMGTGLSNPIGGMMTLITMILIPALFMFLGILITVGASLSIYVPLIPYIVFTFGAIGWLTSTIEAMVAGPLVALGILSPGGQHELLGKAEGALMLLFNIFLRPSLMIFGLIAAMLMARVVIFMINETFFNVRDILMSTSVTGAFDPIVLILFIFAYAMMIVAALNKCFALIHVIPEKVMRWIGGQGEQYGEGEALQKVEQGLGAGAGKVAGATSSVGKFTSEKGKAAKDALEKKGGQNTGGGNSPQIGGGE